MNRAVERHNLARFTPVGHARDLVTTTLRLTVEAIVEGDTTLAAAILGQVEPESPDNSVATVAGCIGLALGLLDDWLSGNDPHAPSNLGAQLRLPAGHWLGERAANDILVLARKGRAFRSLNTLITRQGGEQVLYGSALALGRSNPNLGSRNQHAGCRTRSHRPPLKPAEYRPNHQPRVATMPGTRPVEN